MKEHGMLFKGDMVRATQKLLKTQTRRIPTSGNTLVDGSFVSSKTWKAYEWDWSRAFVDAGPSPAGNPGPYLKVPSPVQDTVHRLYPQWYKGDLLWVRETWSPMWNEACENCDEEPEFHDEHGHCEHFYVEYRADTGNKRPGDWPDPEPNGDYGEAPGWKASIHMPRWASRITLRITDVRPERIQEITLEDVRAEGVPETWGDWGDHRPDMQPHEWDNMRYDEQWQWLWDSINGPRGHGWDQNDMVWALTFTKESK